jgi:hypothetical protein
MKKKSLLIYKFKHKLSYIKKNLKIAAKFTCQNRGDWLAEAFWQAERSQQPAGLSQWDEALATPCGVR